jgi:hypothetical protein
MNELQSDMVIPASIWSDRSFPISGEDVGKVAKSKGYRTSQNIIEGECA